MTSVVCAFAEDEISGTAIDSTSKNASVVDRVFLLNIFIFSVLSP